MAAGSGGEGGAAEESAGVEDKTRISCTPSSIHADSTHVHIEKEGERLGERREA